MSHPWENEGSDCSEAVITSSGCPVKELVLKLILPHLVYLKTRGIDPASHPVAEQLDRVREYYAKIKAIENPEPKCECDQGTSYATRG